MVSEDKKRVMISLSKNTLQKLDEFKDDYEMSYSQIIQFLILDYFKKKGM